MGTTMKRADGLASTEVVPRDHRRGRRTVAGARSTDDAEEAVGRLEPFSPGSAGQERWLGEQRRSSVVDRLVAPAMAWPSVRRDQSSRPVTLVTGYVVEVRTADLPAELVHRAVVALLDGIVPAPFALAWAAFGAVSSSGRSGSGLRALSGLGAVVPTWNLSAPRHRHDGPCWLGLVAALLALRTA